MEEALAHGQELPAQAHEVGRVEEGRVLQDLLLQPVDLVLQGLHRLRLAVHDVVKDQVGQGVRPLPDPLQVQADGFLQAQEEGGAEDVLAAHGDQEVLPHHEVGFPDDDGRTGEAGCVDQEEGARGEILDLGDLLVVQAVLHRERVDAQRLDQGRQVGGFGADVVQPDVPAVPARGDGLGRGSQALESPFPGDDVKSVLRHASPPRIGKASYHEKAVAAASLARTPGPESESNFG